ncbi:MAG: glutaredoxin family protein [Candidatus Competibacter sp.]|nr:glutaredoxin family protein [Candidatus Competibacter sp.]MDS4069084.1 glutaredoxin family protein [Candidatus Competibacter sp.]
MTNQDSGPILVLYTTIGCHLCERAEGLVRQQTDMAVGLVEIADDAELLERYGVRIPVLRRLDTGEELDWPFDVTAIRRLLAVQNPHG